VSFNQRKEVMQESKVKGQIVLLHHHRDIDQLKTVFLAIDENLLDDHIPFKEEK